MERLTLNKLLEWKNSSYRKPLILKGVRQVGKTWILKEFGRRYYENTAYFNFDENEEYSERRDSQKYSRQNAVKHGILRHYERRFYYDKSAFCLLGQKISVDCKILKVEDFDDFSNGFTPRLHLLKVNHPMTDESTLRDAGCFFDRC